VIKKLATLTALLSICFYTTIAHTTTDSADDIMRCVLDSICNYRTNHQRTLQRLNYLSDIEKDVNDPMLLGELYRQRGHYEQDYGNTASAHINFQQAIQYYQRIDNDTSAYWQSECLVAIATEFYSLKDTLGLNEVIKNLTSLYSKYPTYPIAYQYYHANYHLADAKYRYTKDIEQQNLFFTYLYKAIDAARHLTKQELIAYQINPAWDYFNLASGFDVYKSPKEFDSITKYIDLCEQYIPLSKIPSDSSNLVYHVASERIWLQYYRHEYDSVEYGFNRLLDMLANDNHILYRDKILNQQQLYLFIKEYNHSIGHYQKAYDYQALQYEEERKIFDIEKMRAISNIEIQFDAERKEQEILRLKQRNDVIMRNYTIAVISIVTLLIIIILTIIIRRILQKNREQSLYEAALEAELQKESRNTTLRQTIKRMTIDFPKYADLLNEVDVDKMQSILDQATSPLTALDVQYVIVFQGMNLKPAQAAEMFNVEAASIYTVRYRIRKKFPPNVFENV